MDIFSDIFAETLILSIDSLIIGFCVKQLYHCKHIISGLQAAPVLNVDANLKKELTKYPDGIIPYVVLRGSVKALGNPIRSSHNDSVTGVIQKLTLKEHVVARTPAGFWSDQARTVHEVFNSMPFVLSNGKIDIEVVDALSADLLDMDVIADKFEPLSPSVIDHLWGFFSGVRQRGLQTMEEMLRDGTYITAVGELSTSDTGSLKIQPPRSGLPLYLTITTKSILLRKLVNSREFLKILLLVFGSVAMVVSGRIVMKYIKKKRKQEAEEKMKQQLAVGRRERRAQAREKNLDEVQLCVVCAENPKEIILIPCGHVAICEDCSDNIKDVCPVCRHPIESKSPAFIA